MKVLEKVKSIHKQSPIYRVLLGTERHHCDGHTILLYPSDEYNFRHFHVLLNVDFATRKLEPLYSCRTISSHHRVHIFMSRDTITSSDGTYDKSLFDYIQHAYWTSGRKVIIHIKNSECGYAIADLIRKNVPACAYRIYMERLTTRTNFLYWRDSREQEMLTIGWTKKNNRIYSKRSTIDLTKHEIADGIEIAGVRIEGG